MRSTTGARVAVPARFSQPVGDRLPNVTCAMPRNGTQFAPHWNAKKARRHPLNSVTKCDAPELGAAILKRPKPDERTCGSGVGGATVATSNVAYCHDNTLLKTTSLI
jgi:hypothetical protein